MVKKIVTPEIELSLEGSINQIQLIVKFIYEKQVLTYTNKYSSDDNKLIKNGVLMTRTICV